MSLGRRSRFNVAKARGIVFGRDDHECVVGGLFEGIRWPCAGGLTVQHRVGRGMGGSAKYDALPYLITMCAFHNGLETSDAVFHAACLKAGWSIPRWVADLHDIGQIPVRYADGWFLLSGSDRVRIPDSVATTVIDEIYLYN